MLNEYYGNYIVARLLTILKIKMTLNKVLIVLTIIALLAIAFLMNCLAQCDTNVERPILKDSILTTNQVNTSTMSQLYSNPFISTGGRFLLYYLSITGSTVNRRQARFNLHYLDTTATKVTNAIESVFKWKNFIQGSQHSWFQGQNYQQIKRSTDGGISFAPISQSMLLGEDGWFDVSHTDTIWWYIRPTALTTRKIGLKKSIDDGISWTTTQTILFPDTNDITNHIEFYVMPTFHIVGDNGTFGLLTIINTVSNDVYVQLTYATNGTDFIRCKYKQTFLPIPFGIHQQYPLPVVYNDTLHILTSQSKTLHGTAGELFEGIYDFTIPCASLAQWKKVVGDLNGDLFVDNTDLTIIYNAIVSPDVYNPNYDLNCDNVIDAQDLIIIYNLLQ